MQKAFDVAIATNLSSQHGLLHQRRYGAAEHADWRVMTSSPCSFTLSQWQFCTRKIHC